MSAPRPLGVETGRLLAALGAAGASIGAAGTQVGAAGPDRLVLSGAGGTVRVAAATVAAAARAGLVRREGERLLATPEGAAFLRRLKAADAPFAAQHGAHATRVIAAPEGRSAVTVNLAESALARLHLRRDRDGASWIDAEELAAGERLRADFEKAGIAPRISANWIASVGGRGRGTDGGTPSDMAIDARARVERALDRLDGDMAGVALDVCCFGKGLEEIERDRRWPARSAKLILRSALRLLARHYGIASAPRRSSPILFWQAGA